jgi:predicted methyltransferase
MLDKVTALQPVHYFWRTSEFPDRHFGDTQNYGLIAQDVEQVLPELVATDSDGYKVVDYSKLPLLTIQAVKDLKSENDALKQRVSELERLVSELLAATPRPMTRR